MIHMTGQWFLVFTCPGAFLPISGRTHCLKMRESGCPICWLMGGSTENMVCRESVPFPDYWEAAQRTWCVERVPHLLVAGKQHREHGVQRECPICWLLGSSTENMVCRKNVPFAGCWEAAQRTWCVERVSHLLAAGKQHREHGMQRECPGSWLL